MEKPRDWSDYRERTTQLGEEGGRNVGHTSPTHWRVVAATERRSRACGRVGDFLPKMFLPIGRSGQGDSRGGVVNQKQRCQK